LRDGLQRLGLLGRAAGGVDVIAASGELTGKLKAEAAVGTCDHESHR
jgi:hypothetical protein